MPGTEPGVPGPLRLHALEIAKSRVGLRERGGRNRGHITEWSQQGIVQAYKPLPWCAYFVSQCFRQAAIARGDAVLLNAWMRLASGGCDELYRGLAGRGWEIKEGTPGDLLFFGRPEDPNHVGIQSMDALYISGNAGPRSDSVYEGRIKNVVRAVRVPW